MNYEKMTDLELIELYCQETCPYNKMNIAGYVKDEKQRKKLMDHAKHLRHKEEAEEW